MAADNVYQLPHWRCPQLAAALDAESTRCFRHVSAPQPKRPGSVSSSRVYSKSKLNQPGQARPGRALVSLPPPYVVHTKNTECNGMYIYPVFILYLLFTWLEWKYVRRSVTYLLLALAYPALAMPKCSPPFSFPNPSLSSLSPACPPHSPTGHSSRDPLVPRRHCLHPPPAGLHFCDYLVLQLVALPSQVQHPSCITIAVASARTTAQRRLGHPSSRLLN
jgi:hypothetical protein